MDLTSFFQSTLIPDMKKEEPKKPEKKQGSKKENKKETKKGSKLVRYRLPVTLYSNYTEPVIVGGDEFPEELTESEILKEARDTAVLSISQPKSLTRKQCCSYRRHTTVSKKGA